jgi:hypothetical protein
VFSVYENQGRDGCDKGEVERKRESESVTPDDPNPKKSSQRFYCGIAGRYVHLARAAATTQHQVTQYRHVIVENDYGAARRTTRAWYYHRLFARYAMDDHVKEAAYDGAKNSCEEINEWWWD